MKRLSLGFLPIALLVSASCAMAVPEVAAQTKAAKPAKAKGKMQELVIGGGCFWCLEPLFEDLIGVEDVEVAYAGGESTKVTYRDVCSGTTGHAEALKIKFDPAVITARELLTMFMVLHDPTTKDRQGGDVGPQYRSVVFYSDDATRDLARSVFEDITAKKIWKNPIVTTLEPLKNYVRAEEYHQDYYEKFAKASDAERATMNAGYCSAIVEPKVVKFRKEYAAKLKKKG
ncbi:MAG: peptide-methionine (S)-S-oxide reductase MsrA [Chthonomonas sp.]|nr:peptide-methionine (S)-S-oxide reductase MsrA [Chthonomonas sp.]